MASPSKRNIHKTYCIGRGTFGDVFKATWNRQPCAAKVLNILPDNKEEFATESNNLSHLFHPNVTHYLGFEVDHELGCVVYMECIKETLHMTLCRSSIVFPYHVQVDLCLDIAKGLEYLHSEGIIHGNLTSSNVLVAPNKIAKLSDYGLTKIIEKARRVRLPFSGRHNLYEVYMAPELIRNGPEGTDRKKSDCFSMGVLIIEICTRQAPNPEPNEMQMESNMSSIASATFVIIPEKDRRESDISKVEDNSPLRACALQCIADENQSRPQVSEVVKQLQALERAQAYQESIQSNEGGLIYDESYPNRTCTQESETWLKITRGDSVVKGPVAYFRTGLSICSYDSTTKQWRELEDCPNRYGSIAIVEGRLTSIGGCNKENGDITNELACFEESGPHGKWKNKCYTDMPTKRSHSVAIYLEDQNILAVAGGQSSIRPKDCLKTVEVLNLNTQQWSTATPLPVPISSASVTVCGDRAYLLGGNDKDGVTKVVLTCLLKELGSTYREVWSHCTEVPVYKSTCTTLGNQLIVVGGNIDRNFQNVSNLSNKIYRYNSHSKQWEVFGRLQAGRYYCHVATFHGAFEDLLVVAGGDQMPRSLSFYLDVAIFRK